jgi:valine dehydrogenase (NAD+)
VPATHEQVVHCHDRQTGLRAIIAIHSTALGPALGGTRCYPYPDEDAALADVLRLSRAMSYKNALAGLDHGGGKAVIIADPETDKTPQLLAAYGKFVDALGGRYVTACDVGTYVQDMDEVATQTPFVTGRSPGRGGSGDSGILTAFGVFQAMLACAEHLWGRPSLAGRRVGILGAGKVGRRLAGHLAGDGASVLLTDLNAAAAEAVAADHPQVEVLADPEGLPDADLDVFSPCAMGGALTADVVDRLTAAVVCGGANNQLAEPAVADRLAGRGILYAPDFLVNSGGVIQVADELHGFDMERARKRAAGIRQTTTRVLTLAADRGVLPETAAEEFARQRMTEGPFAMGIYRRVDRAADPTAGGIG